MSERLAVDDRPINLTQALKLCGWADTGGQAKAWIAEGHVLVNGQPESRKRRQLQVGDRIALDDGRSLVLERTNDG
jgi:ribosome-associated protein